MSLFSLLLFTLSFKNGPFPASFCVFSSFSRYNFNTNWKKRRWCAWNSNPGPQDGRRRQNHGAMADTLSLNVPSISISSSVYPSRVSVPSLYFAYFPNKSIIYLFLSFYFTSQSLSSPLYQCDQIWRFIGLLPTFKCFWQHLICPNLSHSIFIDIWQFFSGHTAQCVQIGRFLIVVVDKFSYKSCPNIWWLFVLI